LKNHSKRNICLHFHIFKNAGTTIDWILKKNFSKNAVTVDDIENPGTIIPFSIVLKYLEKYPNTKSVSSHQIRFPLPDFSEIQFVPILFVRDPIDRVFSVYNFKKTMNDNTEGTLKAKNSTLTEFVKWTLNTHYMVTENYQVGFLSNFKENGIPIPDLEIAKSRLRECSILGVVERINESLVLAEDILKPFFGNIDLSYIKQNISQNLDHKTKASFYSAKFQINEKFIDELKTLNNLDIKLHESANKELDGRIDRLENFEKKLVDFQKRCKNNLFNGLKVKLSVLQKNIMPKYFEGFQIR